MQNALLPAILKNQISAALKVYHRLGRRLPEADCRSPKEPVRIAVDRHIAKTPGYIGSLQARRDSEHMLPLSVSGLPPPVSTLVPGHRCSKPSVSAPRSTTAARHYGLNRSICPRIILMITATGDSDRMRRQRRPCPLFPLYSLRIFFL